jgi:hypothetical protein
MKRSVVVLALLLLAGCGGGGGGGNTFNPGNATRTELIGTWRQTQVNWGNGAQPCPASGTVQGGPVGCVGDGAAVLTADNHITLTFAEGTIDGTWSYNQDNVTLFFSRLRSDNTRQDFTARVSIAQDRNHITLTGQFLNPSTQSNTYERQ